MRQAKYYVIPSADFFNPHDATVAPSIVRAVNKSQIIAAGFKRKYVSQAIKFDDYKDALDSARQGYDPDNWRYIRRWDCRTNIKK